MFPEEYRSTILSLAEADEDMKTLLGLFHLLEGYTTEEAITKNFTAMTGGKDCKDLLNLLRKRGLIKIGAYNEYLCLSGYEEVFNDIAVGYSPQPGDLSGYLENAVEKGDKAALKMIELLLKISKRGLRGFTQYEIIKNEVSEIFSLGVFQSLEEKFINEKLCVYGNRRGNEFLGLYLSEDKIKDAKERLRAWKTNKLVEMPVIETLEKEIGELVENARRKMKLEGREEGLADTLSIPESEKVADTVGYFSGFAIDDAFMFVTGNVLLERDSLYLVITDSLSRYEVREWRTDYPAIFILEEIPKWVGKIEFVFKDAYPRLSDRKLAIAVPNEVAYSNFKHKLLSELVNRLGIKEVTEIPKR